MILTTIEAKAICEKLQLSDVECLSVIQTFIYQKRGVDVKAIARPATEQQVLLMGIAYETACKYFLQ